MKSTTNSYHQLHHWGAVGCYMLSTPPVEMERKETAIRALVCRVAEVRGLTGLRGKTSRQAIARKLRKHGLMSGYAADLTLETTA